MTILSLAISALNTIVDALFYADEIEEHIRATRCNLEFRTGLVR